MATEPINRLPNEMCVNLVESFQVNAHKVGEHMEVIIFQFVPQGDKTVACVGLSLPDREQLDGLIADLKRMRDLTWPTPKGVNDASAANGDVGANDRPATDRPGSAGAGEDKEPDQRGG